MSGNSEISVESYSTTPLVSSRTSSTSSSQNDNWVHMNDDDDDAEAALKLLQGPLEESFVQEIRQGKIKTLQRIEEGKKREEVIVDALGIEDVSMLSEIDPSVNQTNECQQSKATEEEEKEKEAGDDDRVDAWCRYLRVALQGTAAPSTSLLSSPACPTVSTFSPESLLENLDNMDLPPHKDEDQVKLDIQRSFTILNHIQSVVHNTSIPAMTSSSYSSLVTSSAEFNEQLEKGSSFATILSTSDINSLKKILSNLIIKVLRKYPCLNYYQGYHDIASIVLLVCYKANHNELIEEDINQDLAFKILEKLTVLHLRDFMVTDINLSVDHLRLIPAIIESIDAQLFQLIKQTSASYQTLNGHFDFKFFQPLSSILTFYAHDLTNLSHILHVWDTVLSYNTMLMNVYIYASSLLTLKPKIWDALSLDPEQEEFTSIDADLVHAHLSPTRLFEELTDSDLEKILNKAKEMYQDVPIEKVASCDRTWGKWFENYNQHSVLQTTSSPKLDSNEIDEKYRSLFSDAEELTELVRTQDNEIHTQILDELQEQQQLLKQQQEEEELLHNSLSSSYDDESDIESSNLDSLSSSLTLNTSQSIHKFTSSRLFKSIFASPPPGGGSGEGAADDNEKKATVSRSWTWLKWSNIYKVSITVGVIGVFIHLLIIKHYSYKQILNGEVVNDLRENVVHAGSYISKLLTGATTITTTTTTIPPKNILQVGTGGLHNTIYRFD
ncbi:GYP8 [Candida theae]|uniref:Oxidant-induced cell-cycle arrest protein 5 n=1 Tax=Candida theae TaxID=1198502 RepID=A0AAD5BAV7_9ASCO|nr:GYP8 [Candida theae]KAI5949131.1 GYP8 [Candida theae]